MTVSSVEQGAVSEVLTIGLSDGSFFRLRLSYLERVDSLPPLGQPVSEAGLADCLGAAAAYEAELAALRLVSLREHSRHLLSAKLMKRGHGGGAIRISLDRLESLGLLDDERFAAAWLAARRAARPEGRAKLLSGLLSRGVARETAERVLRCAFSEEAELDAARRCLSRVRGELEVLDLSVLRKLRSRGFSANTIRRAQKALNGDD